MSNTTKEKTFVEGIYFNKPHEKAPDFVKMSVTIEGQKLVDWLNKNSDSEGKVRISVKEGRTGTWYGELDAYKKPEPKEDMEEFEFDRENLPF